MSLLISEYQSSLILIVPEVSWMVHLLSAEETSKQTNKQTNRETNKQTKLPLKTNNNDEVMWWWWRWWWWRVFSLHTCTWISLRFYVDEGSFIQWGAWMRANIYIRIPEVTEFGSCLACATFMGRRNYNNSWT